MVEMVWKWYGNINLGYNYIVCEYMGENKVVWWGGMLWHSNDWMCSNSWCSFTYIVMKWYRLLFEWWRWCGNGMGI